MVETDKSVISLLLKNEVLKFGKFTLKSGRKSSYFYNTRRLNDGNAMIEIGKYYADVIEKNSLKFEVIIGPSYAGIPLAISAAEELARRGKNVRFVYDRKESKNYDDEKDRLFVGDLNDDDRAIILDDVITDGGTKLDMLAKIKATGKNIKIIGLVVLFDRQEGGKTGMNAVKEMEGKDLPVYSVLTATELFDHLHNKRIDGKIIVDDVAYNNFKKNLK
ncbi:MAG: orotate phosphoribosyltransferase [Candidatus Micrarchaeota archaeon]